MPTDSERQRSLLWALLQPSSGEARVGRGFLGHPDRCHLPGRNGSTRAGTPWPPPGPASETQVGAERACPLASEESRSWGKPQSILQRRQQEEDTQAQVPGDHRPVGLSPSSGWLGGVPSLGRLRVGHMSLARRTLS